MSNPRRGDVYLVSLDPTQGQEIKKVRPCAIVSPNELNDHLSTFMVAPMTTGGHGLTIRAAGNAPEDRVRDRDHQYKPLSRDRNF